jgi:hypothetical protein
MGLISDMETVSAREIARLIMLLFVLLVLFTGFIALLLFIFLYLGLLDGFFSPLLSLAYVWPLALLGGIFIVIPFWLFALKFLNKFKFGKEVFVK